MDQVGGYNEKLPFAEDCDLFLRLAEVTQFREVPGSPFYLYRSWTGSESRRRRPRRRARQVIAQIQREAILRRYGIRVAW